MPMARTNPLEDTFAGVYHFGSFLSQAFGVGLLDGVAGSLASSRLAASHFSRLSPGATIATGNRMVDASGLGRNGLPHATIPQVQLWAEAPQIPLESERQSRAIGVLRI